MRDSFLAIAYLSVPISSSKASPPLCAFDFPLTFLLDALVHVDELETPHQHLFGFDEDEYAAKALIFVLLTPPFLVDRVFYFCSL